MTTVLTNIPLHDEGARPGEGLAVLLGSLFRERCRSHRMRQIINSYKDNDTTIVLLSDVEQDEFGNEGTVSDIYKAATLAKERGWKAMAVIDALAWRQLAGRTKVGEDDRLTANVVHMEYSSSLTVQPNPSTFYIRRLDLETAVFEAAGWPAAMPLQPTPQPWSYMGPALHVLMSDGFYLRDPLESAFVEDGSHRLASALLTKVLELKPSLPEEVRAMIGEYADSVLSLDALADTSPIEGDCAVVQCLTPLTEGRLGVLQRRLDHEFQQVWDPSKVHVRAWKPSKTSPNWRDVSRLVAHADSARVMFFDGSVDAEDLRLIFVNAENMRPLCYRRATVREAREDFGFGDVDQYQWYRTPWKRPPHENKNVPFLDPTAAFPANSPSWMCASHVDDYGYVAQVFFLTNALTEDEKETIISELHQEGDMDHDLDGLKGYVFVPWEFDKDGGPADMLRITKAFGGGRWENQIIGKIFVDLRSARDRKVILCGPHWSSFDHDESGIEYGRVAGREAIFTLMLLDVKGSLDDHIDQDDGLQVHHDPDYEGPPSDDGADNGVAVGD